MAKEVLVAYATRHGRTAEIADKNGEVPRDAGLHAAVLRAGRSGDLSLYNAVAVGSAVYVGRWRKEAATFLRDNETLLAQMRWQNRRHTDIRAPLER